MSRENDWCVWCGGEISERAWKRQEKYQALYPGNWTTTCTDCIVWKNWSARLRREGRYELYIWQMHKGYPRVLKLEKK